MVRFTHPTKTRQNTADKPLRAGNWKLPICNPSVHRPARERQIFPPPTAPPRVRRPGRGRPQDQPADLGGASIAHGVLARDALADVQGQAALAEEPPVEPPGVDAR